MFADVDVLLLSMTLNTGPAWDDQAGITAFTTQSAGSVFSLTGHPAIAVPSGFDEDGLPVSVQLAAAFRDEGTVLRAAVAVEQAPRRAVFEWSDVSALPAATPQDTEADPSVYADAVGAIWSGTGQSLSDESERNRAGAIFGGALAVSTQIARQQDKTLQPLFGSRRDIER